MLTYFKASSDEDHDMDTTSGGDGDTEMEYFGNASTNLSGQIILNAL